MFLVSVSVDSITDTEHSKLSFTSVVFTYMQIKGIMDRSYPSVCMFVLFDRRTDVSHI